MKKVLTALCLALACSSVMAQEAAAAPGDSAPKASSATKASWPMCLAFNSTDQIDVVGLRLTLPGGTCESVTGFDLGIEGRCRYFEGLQVNLLRNDVFDKYAGIQVGFYNTVGTGNGLQIGIFNEAHELGGVQVGLINTADKISGVQIGLINRAESAYGFQVGGVNVIRDSDLTFCPILNIGFEAFPNY